MHLITEELEQQQHKAWEDRAEDGEDEAEVRHYLSLSAGGSGGRDQGAPLLGAGAPAPRGRLISC